MNVSTAGFAQPDGDELVDFIGEEGVVELGVVVEDELMLTTCRVREEGGELGEDLDLGKRGWSGEVSDLGSWCRGGRVDEGGMRTMLREEGEEE